MNGRLRDRPELQDVLPVAGIFVLAVAVRWLFLWIGDHAGLSTAYDPSTYYNAAAALLHGRMPYHGDFTFMHPPLVILFGVPFAALGAVTTAHTGFVAASMACGVLGAGSAAGVTWIALDWGVSRFGALTGGAFLAVWSTSVSVQSVLHLEPIGDFLLVLALVLLGPPRALVGRRRLAAAGIAFGLLVNVKVWWFAVVAAVLLLRMLRRARWTELRLVLLVAAATAVVLDLPFLLVARGRMWHSVVTAQLGRPPVQGTPDGKMERFPVIARLDQVTGIWDGARQFLDAAEVFTSTTVHALTIVMCLAFLVTAAFALFTELGRFAVPLAGVQVITLMTAPIFFPIYADFVTVGVGLTLAAGVGAMAEMWGPRALPSVAVWMSAALVPLVIAATHTGLLTGGLPVADASSVKTLVAGPGCVVSDSPRALIAMDLVDRSLSGDCRNFVDVQGVGHGAGPDPTAGIVHGRANRAWRRELSRYLRSGSVMVLADPTVRYLLGPARTRMLTRGRPATRLGAIAVFGPPTAAR